jgi:hypothetical protein
MRDLAQISTRFILLPMLIVGFLAGCPGTSSTLEVRPAVVSFGEAGQVETISLYNSGSGASSWTLSENLSWLSAERTSGTTAGLATDRVKLTVDRTGLDPGSYAGTVTVTSGGVQNTIQVSMMNAGDPELAVAPPSITLSGAGQQAFTITNNGDGILNWGISFHDADSPQQQVSLPAGISVSPTSGQLASGASEEASVSVSREELQQGQYEFIIRVSSIAGSRDVPVTIVLGEGAEIGVTEEVLTFAPEDNVLTFEVFNAGAASTELDFNVSTDREDLIGLSPTEGTSTGVLNLDENWDPVEIQVTLFRDQMQGETDSATITISSDDAESVELPVTIERADLRFEGAINRTRPPFIMRFIFTMRDSVNKVIDTRNDATFQALQEAFTVIEDGRVIDEDETEIFVSKPDNLRYDLVLMLDYTGSMDAQLREAHPGRTDPLQDLYGGNRLVATDGLVANFLDGLPETWNVALMEHHRRQQQNRILAGFGTTSIPEGESEADSPLYTAVDEFRLSTGEHGASELYDALADACLLMASRDINVLPLNDADVRALVFITDGRDTSSITTASDVVDLARDLRVRLYPIGFGDTVDSVSLQEMALETGGHYYAAPTEADLRRLLADDPQLFPAEEGGRVVKELKRQVVLTYNTLFQEGSHEYLIRAEWEGREGVFESEAVFAVGGDVRAGQIALSSNGIGEDGSAEVLVRADYVPRAISQFRMRFVPPDALVSLYPADWQDRMQVEIVESGLLDGWQTIAEPDAEGQFANSLVYTFITNETEPLQFSNFGNLVRVRLDGLPSEADLAAAGLDMTDLVLDFRIDNEIYLDGSNSRFFQYPPQLQLFYGARSQNAEMPLLLENGFEPAAPNAWDVDEDGVSDFNDTTNNVNP